MKKKISFGKITTACLLSAITLSSCVACGGKQITKIDSSKSQIYVSYYNGGCNDLWLLEAEKIFEERYANESFEPNKVGVEFINDSRKDGTAGASILAKMKGSNNDIYFTEGTYYQDLVSGDYALDITDLLTEKLTKFGESSISILDKMDEAYLDYYQVNGKYYALPFFQGFKGFIYNKDVFDTKGLYILAEDYVCDSTELVFGKKTDGELSAGPDGKTGTYDDGLPATYNEFFALLDEMLEASVVPFSWSGMYESYLTGSQYELWCDYEGKEQMQLNYSFNGVATDLVDTVNADGTYTLLPEQTITNENAYMLQKQAGKLEALRFIKKLTSNSNYYTTGSAGSSTNNAAQLEFVQNTLNGNPIAFLSEGTWWEQEAAAVFDSISQKFIGKDRKTLRYGLLPMPKANASKVGEDRTIVCLNDTSMFINKRVQGEAKEGLVKLFYQFCQSDEILKLFNKETGMTRAFDYTLTEEDQKTLSEFGRDLYAVTKGGNAEILYAIGSSNFYKKNSTFFQETYWGFKNKTYEQPWRTFIDHSDVSAETYFEGLYTYAKSLWDNGKVK